MGERQCVHLFPHGGKCEESSASERMEENGPQVRGNVRNVRGS